MWFDDDPLGLPGDEDGGALCSWYVFSAMGFYPVTPGNGLYAIGTPFFKKVQIKLPDGKTFTVKADNVSKQNKYIQSAQLNGEELNRAWIKHSEITEGGTLEAAVQEQIALREAFTATVTSESGTVILNESGAALSGLARSISVLG